MLKISRIHIENFRSIRKCTFDVKDIQLLIGPNNSGKTNLLRAFEFLRQVTNYNLIGEIDLPKLKFKHSQVKNTTKNNLSNPVSITVEFENKDYKNMFCYYKIELFETTPTYDHGKYNEFVGISESRIPNEIFAKIDLLSTPSLQELFYESTVIKNNTFNIQSEPSFVKNGYGDVFSRYKLFITKDVVNVEGVNPDFGNLLRNLSINHPNFLFIMDINEIFKRLIIYKPETHFLKVPVEAFSQQNAILGKGENITAYLENLLSSDPERFHKINSELSKCIPDFKSFNFSYAQKVTDNESKTVKLLRLKDKFDIDHLAEDISEGTLYFLMLFAIITQKDIPSILMLEEPETGIHPRRIGEIMEYIFALREQYPHISIILTTHHPYVVDHFKDMTDKVWVFENENGETIIKNLERDIIDPSNKKMEKAEMEPIDFSSSLGEHWAIGLLGGVPKPVKR